MKKYTYIKKSQAGKFLDFPEKFNEELFDNVGSSWEDYEAGKWVLLSAKQVKFHEEHPEASEKEVWEMTLAPQPAPAPRGDEEPVIPVIPEPGKEEESIVEQARARKLKEIDDYDAVYSFVLRGKVMWLDEQQRREILEEVAAYRAMKEKEMTKWLDDTEYTFTLKKWTQLAQRVAVYASKVENVKNTHRKNVRELTDEREIDAYDYMAGYPERPNFNDL